MGHSPQLWSLSLFCSPVFPAPSPPSLLGREDLPPVLGMEVSSTSSPAASAPVFTELSLITLHWFLTAFASVVDIKLLLRIWDLFFYEGSRVLFQLTLGMLHLKVLQGPTSG